MNKRRESDRRYIARLESNERINKNLNTSKSVTKVIRTIIIAACVFGCLLVVMIYLNKMTMNLTGRETKADILINLATSFKLDVVLPWIVAAGGVGYGVRERKLRRDFMKRSVEKTTMLEEHINPERVSSSLAEDGKTNKGDEW